MKIHKIELQNFRNYEHIELNFSDQINILYGNNGSGKSNLVEAIYFLGLTKSFRTNDDSYIRKNKTEFTKVEGLLNSKYETKYKIEFNNEGKKTFIDGNKTKTLSEYISNILIVLFNPLDTRIICDSPASRRKMLDISLSQINKDYLLLLSNYNKILKQRNAYIKQMGINGNTSSDYLNILTTKLIENGLKINKIRKDYIQEINNEISKIYLNIFDSGNVEIKYKSEFNEKDFNKIFEKFKKNFSHELLIGKTLYGIHHDDFEFILDKHNVKDYGSVGQQKNMIISYKLSELLLIKKIKNEYPILILDDLFSELDETKINNIIKMLNREVQTFITTTNINNVDKKLLKDSTLFKIDNGIITRED